MNGKSSFLFIAIFSIMVWFIAGTGIAPAQQAGDTDNPFELGLKFFYQKQYAESREFFQEALDKDPLNAMALSFYLDASYKTGDLIKAVNQIEARAIEMGNTPVMKAQLGIAYISRGLLDARMLDDALQQLKDALRENPDLSIANTGMGMIYFHKRLTSRAKGYFVNALKANPKDLMAMELLGDIVLVDEKKPDTALDIFQKLIQISPRYADGYFMIASCYQRMEKIDNALEYFEKCMEIDPLGVMKGYDAPLRIGDIYLTEKQYDQAIKYYKKAQTINPDNPYAQTQLNKAEARGKDWKGNKVNKYKDNIRE